LEFKTKHVVHDSLRGRVVYAVATSEDLIVIAYIGEGFRKGHQEVVFKF
jgi:hypothetical protein